LSGNSLGGAAKSRFACDQDNGHPEGMDPLVEYYGQRAPEYEDIYRRNDPVRQTELNEIGQIVRTTFLGKRVLEVACGTGFWTQIIAEGAETAAKEDWGG